MIANQDTKEFILWNATAATTGTGSTGRVDTLGFRHASFVAWMPTATATDSTAKWLVLKVTEGDTTVLTSASAIVKFTGTTNTVTDSTNGFVISAHSNTAASGAHKISIDCRGRKRYLFLYFGPPASHSTVVVTAQLSRPEEMPNTGSEAGITGLVAG